MHLGGYHSAAMYPFSSSQIDSLRTLCHLHHVQRLDLIGSGASGEFDPATSDLDFLVEFGPLAPGTAADTYFALQEALEALFNRPVDLVMTGAATNPYFRRTIEKSRVNLYAA